MGEEKGARSSAKLSGWARRRGRDGGERERERDRDRERESMRTSHLCIHEECSFWRLFSCPAEPRPDLRSQVFGVVLVSRLHQLGRKELREDRMWEQETPHPLTVSHCFVGICSAYKSISQKKTRILLCTTYKSVGRFSIYLPSGKLDIFVLF